MGDRSQDTPSRPTALAVFDQAIEAFNGGDLAAVAETIDERCVRDDRRRVIALPRTESRDQWMEQIRVTADSGFSHMTREVVAAHHPAVALLRVVLSSSTNDVTTMLLLVRIGAHGRIDYTAAFDPDAEGEALREVERHR